MAGPALSAAATPVNTKMPVPMMAPTPRAVRPTGPSTRLRRFSPSTSARSFSRGFVAKSCFRMLPFLTVYLPESSSSLTSILRIWTLHVGSWCWKAK